VTAETVLGIGYGRQHPMDCRPGLAFLLWLLQVGPAPQINFTALVFPVHLAFDAYAFFSRDMFELTPAARRAGERAAIDDLGTAVIIVDDEDRIVNLNDEGEHVLDAEKEAILGRPLAEFLGTLDPGSTDDSISITTDGVQREYAVTTSPIQDGGGTRVGATIVLQDVTDERQREQRLAVLNRVLRHNLRNDLNVVEGYLSVMRERADEGELPDLHAAAEEKTLGVIELAVLETGEETALEHGSGLGLWLVEWGVASLGGEVDFVTNENGTTAVIELPNASVAA
jgi:PAS domain S-box-containing protein